MDKGKKIELKVPVLEIPESKMSLRIAIGSGEIEGEKVELNHTVAGGMHVEFESDGKQYLLSFNDLLQSLHGHRKLEAQIESTESIIIPMNIYEKHSVHCLSLGDRILCDGIDHQTLDLPTEPQTLHEISELCLELAQRLE